MDRIQKGRQLFFLDRNVVDLIKGFNSGRKITDPKKIAKLNFLREIDTARSLVTPILSMIEGQKGRKESFQEKLDIAEKETEAVRAFFAKARTDSETIQGLKPEFASAFSEHSEEDWGNVENFLREACPFIANKITKNDRAAAELEILSAAEKNNVPAGHLAVALCLGCLYGSDAAREVIKPGRIKEKTHNVMSDINIVPKISLVKALMAMIGIDDIEIAYVTCDEGLEKVLDCIQVVDIRFNENKGEILQKIRYGKALFPSLNKREYLHLMAHMHQRGDGFSQRWQRRDPADL